MTNSESILRFGSNAYTKPSSALSILRETIMGREAFDYAFKTYCRRWAFKHPSPADFFRTMEDASGIDLDWFWRGWFYTSDHVDIGIVSASEFTFEQRTLAEQKKEEKEVHEKKNYIGYMRDATDVEQTAVERKSYLNDFYNEYDAFSVKEEEQKEYDEKQGNLGKREKELLKADKLYYQLTFENKGGLVMPIILKINYQDGDSEVRYLPAEIWKLHDDEVTKVFITTKKVSSFALDPYLETADADLDNNVYPRVIGEVKMKLSNAPERSTDNPMRKAKGDK